jgi:hypothetical protein
MRMLEMGGYTLDDVLAWLNAERKARSYGPPLTEMPKGKRLRACLCPVAEALGGSVVDGTDWYPVELEENNDGEGAWQKPIPLGECVRLFITDFDAGYYPELELR